MILALDIGNSNIKFGVHRDGAWARRFRVSSERGKTPDEYSLTFGHLLERIGVRLDEVDVAVMSSVVPPLAATLAEMLAEAIGRPPLVVGPGVRSGIRIRTDNPVEVGADIVVNAAAAHERVKSDCVVVAFGTALTFSAVNASGDFLGCAIAPGPQAAAEALVRSTAQLRLVEYAPPPAAIGKNTIHSLQSGIVFGYVGLIEGLVGRFRAELGGAASVVTTGDLARSFLPLTDCLGDFEPWLTLDGLRLIAERNA